MSDWLAKLLRPFGRWIIRLADRLEMHRYQESLKRNPNDHDLRARFTKYCIRRYFRDQETGKEHVVEAVNQFENIVHSDYFDLEVFYLMGKYYHGQDDERARGIYRQGIASFNQYIAKNPALKEDYIELAFAMALNLLKLEKGKDDPEVIKFFTTVRRTFLKKYFLEDGVSPPPSKGISDWNSSAVH